MAKRSGGNVRKHSPKRSAAKRVDGFKRVALILGQDIGYCRGVLRGVQTFAATRERWILRDAAPSMSVAAALRE